LKVVNNFNKKITKKELDSFGSEFF